jgi:hypothetical protein
MYDYGDFEKFDKYEDYNDFEKFKEFEDYKDFDKLDKKNVQENNNLKKLVLDNEEDEFSEFVKIEPEYNFSLPATSKHEIKKPVNTLPYPTTFTNPTISKPLNNIKPHIPTTTTTTKPTRKIDPSIKRELLLMGYLEKSIDKVWKFNCEILIILSIFFITSYPRIIT